MKKKITIIDYGLGNLASVANALEKLKIPYEISSDGNVISNATALILPGVGAAGQGMKNLKSKKLVQVILEQAKKGTPILGICLGMQLMLSFSKEGNTTCLGLTEGRVKKFDTNLKIPQIGWNRVRIQNNELGIMKKIKNNSYFYFVNSYYCELDNEKYVTGVTEYGLPFCSIFENKKLYGVQFHPEKSGGAGLQLLKNFGEVVC